MLYIVTYDFCLCPIGAFCSKITIYVILCYAVLYDNDSKFSDR